MGSPLFACEMLIQEIKHIRLPSRDSQVNEVMTFSGRLAHGRIYFHKMWFPEPFHLRSQTGTGPDRKIVLSMDEKGCGRHPSNCLGETLTQLGRPIPTVTSRAESNDRAYRWMMLCQEYRQRPTERAPNNGNSMPVNFAKREQIGKSGEHIIHLISCQQTKLDGVACALSPGRKCAVHEVATWSALPRRQAISTTIQVEEQISMPGEQRSKQLRMSMVGPACRSASRVPGTVIEKNGGKWSLARRMENQRVKLELTALHDHVFRSASGGGRVRTNLESKDQGTSQR